MVGSSTILMLLPWRWRLDDGEQYNTNYNHVAGDGGEQYTSMQEDAAPVTVQGGSLFRSEEMALCQLFLQSEVGQHKPFCMGLWRFFFWVATAPV